MREQKFSKEPNLVGDMVVATRYAIYYQPNAEDAYPQKITECTENGVKSTMEELISKLKKAGLNIEKKSAEDEYYVSGSVPVSGKNGEPLEHEIDGSVYPSSYQTILNNIPRKAMERTFQIYNKRENDGSNNRGRDNNNYRRGNRNDGRKFRK